MMAAVAAAAGGGPGPLPGAGSAHAPAGETTSAGGGGSHGLPPACDAELGSRLDQGRRVVLGVLAACCRRLPAVGVALVRVRLAIPGSVAPGHSLARLLPRGVVFAVCWRIQAGSRRRQTGEEA